MKISHIRIYIFIFFFQQLLDGFDMFVHTSGNLLILLVYIGSEIRNILYFLIRQCFFFYYVLYVILCVSYAILCLLITMQCLVMSFLHINHCLRIARVRFMHPLEITFVDCITFI